MNIKSVYLLLIINSFLYSQNILLKGQFWSNFLINEKKSSYVKNFGYIPAFSLSIELYNKQLIYNDINEDKELLEDLIISAINKAFSISQKEVQSRMNSVTGGMLGGLNIPGM